MVGFIMLTSVGYFHKEQDHTTIGFIFQHTRIGCGRVVRFFHIFGQIMTKHGIIMMSSKNFFIVSHVDIG